MIQTVSAGSGAEGAGLKAGTEQAVIAGESFRMGGDVIVSADGKPVATIDELRDVVCLAQAGRQDRAGDLPRWRQEDRHRHPRAATDLPLPVAAPAAGLSPWAGNRHDETPGLEPRGLVAPSFGPSRTTPLLVIVRR